MYADVLLMYIGESARTFGERFKEYLKACSPIYDHQNITGHPTTVKNVNIVGRKDHNLATITKAPMYIRVKSQSLNKNSSK